MGPAAGDAAAARRALVKLEGRKLRENDGLVKSEMEGALRTFEKGVRTGEANAHVHAEKASEEMRRQV